MDSIKNTINELTDHFNTRMQEFQKELKSAIPATSPSSNINSQFGSFRSFVLTALENLQLQVELLSRQYDELEMRSRKKILLIHGIPEKDKEVSSEVVTELLSECLKLPQLTTMSLSLCHRLGRAGGDKPRAILVKFRDWSLRNNVWSGKSGLKGTGITVSEFLTKCRHKVFLAARQRFGVAKCWTRDGTIMVMAPDSSRHRITSMLELNAIPVPIQSIPMTSTAPVAAEAPKVVKPSNFKSKRAMRR